MKFEQLTIDQFQRIAAIEMGADQHANKVAIYAIMHGATFDQASALPYSEINKSYKQIEDALKELPALRFKQRVRVSGKNYKLMLYTDTLSAGQLLEILSYPMQTECDVIQALHQIMASLARESKWYKLMPYDGAAHKERSEAFKSATMGDVWGAVSFFLMASEGYLLIMQKFSEAKQTKTMGKELAFRINTAGLS